MLRDLYIRAGYAILRFVRRRTEKVDQRRWGPFRLQRVEEYQHPAWKVFFWRWQVYRFWSDGHDPQIALLGLSWSYADELWASRG